MYFVTKEISENKKLKGILKENLKFKEIEFSEEFKSAKYDSNPLIIGSSFEILFQVEKFKREKNSYKLRNLKYNRGFNLLSQALEIVEDKYKDKIKDWLKEFRKSQQVLIDYIEEGSVSDKKLIKAILFLNFISLFRELKNVYYFKPKYSKEDVKELVKLKDSFSKKILKKLEKKSDFIYFNYVLNDGYLSGEIDILTDNCIYDIKTTSIPVFTKEMLYQLIMYYFLLKRNGIKVKKIAILFSKHSEIIELKIKDLFIKDGESKIEEFLKEEYQL